MAPPWVPWRERIQPGDLSPGDLLPAEEDDPGWCPATPPGTTIVDHDTVKEVGDELGLGRPRVLSLEGRELAAQRWYDGSHGPEAPIAQSAPAHAAAAAASWSGWPGPLSQVFGVCANAYANDDGRVVSYDHGCGAHSEARLSKQNRPAPLPEPVLDTLTWDDLDQF